jgi:hypothetical protein
MIAWDFYLLFTQIFNRYLNWKNADLVRRLNVNQTEENRTAVEGFTTNWTAWRRAYADSPFDRLDTFKFADELKRITPINLFDQREQRAAEAFTAQLVRMVSECEKKGGCTVEAADFYDHYHDLKGYGEKINELFGVNPSELK